MTKISSTFSRVHWTHCKRQNYKIFESGCAPSMERFEKFIHWKIAVHQLLWFIYVPLTLLSTMHSDNFLLFRLIGSIRLKCWARKYSEALFVLHYSVAQHRCSIPIEKLEGNLIQKYVHRACIFAYKSEWNTEHNRCGERDRISNEWAKADTIYWIIVEHPLDNTAGRNSNAAWRKNIE